MRTLTRAPCRQAPQHPRTGAPHFGTAALRHAHSGTAALRHPGTSALRHPGSETRLRSIDVFRGLTVAAMVIVNNPGDWGNVYAPLLHADWHGWTPTDLIFPFFLFIVGVALTLGRTGAGAFSRVARRGAILVGLGLFMAGFPLFNVATWRIPGVLQRIGLCYVAAAFIMRVTRSSESNRIQHMWRIAAVIGALLIGYAALMLLVPVPGGRAGDLSPAGNLGAWLDRALMQGHLWRPDWDPEGLLSTVPAVATTLLGVEAGLALRRDSTRDHSLAVASARHWRCLLLAAGIAGILVGYVWHGTFPINKNLWTSSYVVFTAGAAAIVLALCSVWVDQRDEAWRRISSEPFVALGRNAILLFVLSGLVAKAMAIARVPSGLTVMVWIYAHLFAPFASPKNASLLFAVANLAVLYALLAWLHHRRKYWTV